MDEELNEAYSEREAAKRRDEALKRALNTLPKPKGKTTPPKRGRTLPTQPQTKSDRRN